MNLRTKRKINDTDFENTDNIGGSTQSSALDPVTVSLHDEDDELTGSDDSEETDSFYSDSECGSDEISLKKEVKSDNLETKSGVIYRTVSEEL